MYIYDKLFAIPSHIKSIHEGLYDKKKSNGIKGPIALDDKIHTTREIKSPGLIKNFNCQLIEC